MGQHASLQESTAEEGGNALSEPKESSWLAVTAGRLVKSTADSVTSRRGRMNATLRKEQQLENTDTGSFRIADFIT